MKRIITLLLAAGLVMGAAGAAQAADVKVKGMWDFSFDFANTSFAKGSQTDTFRPVQRLRTQIDIVASESLKGVLFFEIGDTHWGRQIQGAGMGTDGITVEVRYSYIDWLVPNTALKVRMGLQPLIAPNFVSGSNIIDDDAAGITLAYDFNEMFGATLFWARLENNNTNLRSDALDLFGLNLPIKGDGFKVTPFGMYANTGKRSLAGSGGSIGDLKAGFFPIGIDGTTGFADSNKDNGASWWLGLGGEVTAFSPFRAAFDLAWGSVDMGNTKASLKPGDPIKTFDYKRAGWAATFLAEYKLDMMTPGLLFWYASGDDSNPYNGSERMPVIDPFWTASSYGFQGRYNIGVHGVIGSGNTGTWGVIARLADITFMEDLKHTFQVGYYKGTNSDKMPVKANMKSAYGTLYSYDGRQTPTNLTYLTTKDHAWEVNLDTTYQIYKDLTLAVQLGYLNLNLSESAWGKAIVDDTNKSNYKAGVSLRYAF